MFVVSFSSSSLAAQLCPISADLAGAAAEQEADVKNILCERDNAPNHQVFSYLLNKNVNELKKA